MSTPIKLPIKTAKYAREVSAFVKYWPKSPQKNRLNREIGIGTYTKNPLYATVGVFEVGTVLRERADKLTCPVLYIKAENDHHTFQGQPEVMQKYFPDANVEYRIAPDMPHSMLVIGPNINIVHDWIVEWFEDHINNS